MFGACALGAAAGAGAASGAAWAAVALRRRRAGAGVRVASFSPSPAAGGADAHGNGRGETPVAVAIGMARGAIRAAVAVLDMKLVMTAVRPQQASCSIQGLSTWLTTVWATMLGKNTAQRRSWATSSML